MPPPVNLHVNRITIRGYPTALRDEVVDKLGDAITRVAETASLMSTTIPYIRISIAADESLDDAIARTVHEICYGDTRHTGGEKSRANVSSDTRPKGTNKL